MPRFPAPPHALVATWLLLLLGAPVPASASPRFDGQAFIPPPGAEQYLTSEGPHVCRHGEVAVGLTYQLATDIILFPGRRAADPARYAVSRRDTADIVVAVGLLGWLQLSAGLPVILYQRGDQIRPSGTVRQSALGDLRLAVKLRLAGGSGYGGGLGAALVAQVMVPSGDAYQYGGAGTVQALGRLVLEYAHRRFALAANLAYRYRESVQISTLADGQAVLLSLAARAEIPWRIPRTHWPLEVLVDLHGLLRLGLPSNSSQKTQDPLELDGGLRFFPDARHDFALTLGMGGGIRPGRALGSPGVRILASAQYQPELRDRDRDGVGDDSDRCPLLPGPRANRGCPDADRDQDGTLDRLDRCPSQPGSAASGGCPAPDRDADGMADPQDACPAVPGPAATSGCPLPDRDHDGVNDDSDDCPDAPGERSLAGCPR